MFQNAGMGGVVMDLISSMLSTLRLDASIFLHSTFCNEWVIDIGAMNIATFHLVSHGDCWLHFPHKKPVALHERDLVVLPHNAPHLITNSPDEPGADTPRNTPADTVCGPSVTLICGTVTFNQNYWNPLIEALPEYVILPTLDSRETTLGKIIDALINESERGETGSEAIIDRLADILFIEVLRAYVKKEHSNSFLVAITDPKVSQALVAFHAEPGNSWSVESLAAVACMSRSAFAERFQKLSGASPMNYVTRWRMQHAHSKLTETTESIADIAEGSGYQSEESFAKAFRKEFGISPRAVRRRDAANEIAGMVSISGDSAISSKIMYSPLEANELRNSNAVIFIDVRDAGDYAQGHIPGAVNIPELFTTLSMTTPEGLQEMEDTLKPLFSKAGVSRDKTVIFYEDDLGSRFGSSCRAYFQLTFFGHPNAGILDGGFDQWKLEGFPADTSPVVPKPSEFITSIQRSSLATIDDMMKALDHPETKLLDNRDKEEWLGITSSPSGYYSPDFLPRKGRIPGARWVEWQNFMESANGTRHFKSPEQVIAICAQAGLYPDDDIIIYCFKGARAANTYVALKLAGFKHLRNYYGSWNEWSRNASLPAMSVTLVG
ncbi:MAG: cupin domain-containing protein [Gammaproteobacteria bacterium]|nr:cupin domain-containing protein [Gammaproteobacteria bacterium]